MGTRIVFTVVGMDKIPVRQTLPAEFMTAYTTCALELEGTRIRGTNAHKSCGNTLRPSPHWRCSPGKVSSSALSIVASEHTPDRRAHAGSRTGRRTSLR